MDIIKKLNFKLLFIKPKETVKKEKLKENKDLEDLNDTLEKDLIIFSNKVPLVIFLDKSIKDFFKYNIFPILTEINC